MNPTTAAAIVTMAMGFALAAFLVALDNKQAMRICELNSSRVTCFAAMNR